MAAVTVRVTFGIMTNLGNFSAQLFLWTLCQKGTKLAPTLVKYHHAAGAQNVSTQLLNQQPANHSTSTPRRFSWDLRHNSTCQDEIHQAYQTNNDKH